MDADDAYLLDDVLIGDDVATRIDDDAGAHAVDAVLGRRVGKQLLGRRAADGAFAVDVDHGGANPLNYFDDGGATWAGLPRPGNRPKNPHGRAEQNSQAQDAV